jgi:hypothetical protein
MGWKVYFWFYAISTFVGSFTFISKLPMSFGDAISLGYSLLLLVMAYAYAFGKKVFVKKTWEILFWAVMAITVIGLVDFLFVPRTFSQKYYPFLTSQVDGNYAELWLAYIISIPCVIAGYRLTKLKK